MTSKLSKGDKARARVRHSSVKAGTVGEVKAVYSGTYYAMSFPGTEGVTYSPDPHLSPMPTAGGPSGAGDTPSDTGATNASLAPAELAVAWQQLIRTVADLLG